VLREYSRRKCGQIIIQKIKLLRISTFATFSNSQMVTSLGLDTLLEPTR
jgi:hypothetical protein